MKSKSRMLSLAVAAAMALSLGGCKAQEKVTGLSPAQIGDVVKDSQKSLSELTGLAADDGDFSSYLKNSYDIAAADCTDGVVWYSSTVSADEVTVLSMADGVDMAQVGQKLLRYLQRRGDTFHGYHPEEESKLRDAVVVTSGQIAALFVCDDSAAARRAFDDCFQNVDTVEATPGAAEPVERDSRGRVVCDPPLEENMTPYNTSTILTAFADGDKSTLTAKDKRILESAESVIGDVIGPEMTDYEKELAVHDWIIEWTDYDKGGFTPIIGRSDPDSSNPYGVLANQKGLCMGYATTFKLFMDMLDIPCIIVVGASSGSRQDHAWNMVKLDEDWYCVDATWDDSDTNLLMDAAAVRALNHQYFNVTSDQMMASDHQWSYDTVPQATATKYAWVDAAPAQNS